MERIDPSSLPEVAIAEALLSAPGWARVGLTASTEHMRRQAARELALAIINGEAFNTDNATDQFSLL